jgi:hypothetical protein
MLAVEAQRIKKGISTKCCPHRCPFQGASTHCDEESDAIGRFVFVHGKDVFKVVVCYTSVYDKRPKLADREVGSTYA